MTRNIAATFIGVLLAALALGGILIAQEKFQAVQYQMELQRAQEVRREARCTDWYTAVGTDDDWVCVPNNKVEEYRVEKGLDSPPINCPEGFYAHKNNTWYCSRSSR